jgi:hypothetical protein
MSPKSNSRCKTRNSYCHRLKALSCVLSVTWHFLIRISGNDYLCCRKSCGFHHPRCSPTHSKVFTKVHQVRGCPLGRVFDHVFKRQYPRLTARSAVPSPPGAGTRNSAYGEYTSNGDSSHPLNATWRGMIHRCHNPDNSNYPRWGKKGTGGQHAKSKEKTDGNRSLTSS